MEGAYLGVPLQYSPSYGYRSAKHPLHSKASLAITVVGPGNSRDEGKRKIIGEFILGPMKALNDPDIWITTALATELESAGYIVRSSKQPPASKYELRAEIRHFWIVQSTVGLTSVVRCDLTLGFSLFREGALITSFESTENGTVESAIIRNERQELAEECLRSCLLQAQPIIDEHIKKEQ